MLDRTTGNIQIAGQLLCRSLLEDEFASSPLGHGAQKSASSDGWAIYSHIADEEIALVLRFRNQVLAEAQIALKRGNGGWAEWTEQKEQERKADNDKWLALQMGAPPPYRFNWGEVTSIYDPKMGAAVIVVRYSSP